DGTAKSEVGRPRRRLLMAKPNPIELEHVEHFFGEGALRRQILFDVTLRVRAGEVVIVNGPSGSGKTTLLTLIGALRSAQKGSVRILGEELKDAGRRILRSVRRQIGYVFQSHNLLGALTASQNVQASLLLERGCTLAASRQRAREMLTAVGLGARVEDYPEQLSGGQRQRVAIARALARRPTLILADEPTASLDRESGREVVDLMHRLVKQQGASVVLVTHDHRILDIADRVIHLEDGRLTSFTEGVAASTRLLMGMLAQSHRKGDLQRRLMELPAERFRALLEQATQESRQFLEVTTLAESDAFESMLEEALAAFTFRFGQLMDVERASLFLVDAERKELWLKVAQEEGGKPLHVRMPLGRGIASEVATTRKPLRVSDAYSHPLFNAEIDRGSGFRTRSILCVPVLDRQGAVFAVAQLLNRRDGEPFDEEDERRFVEFTSSIGVILESWVEMERRRRR
ncbi:MAG TPA: ATP-binding cassette domain-containing protein, partial [Myxococcota bacterium]|nr:ATP-binding cassette domain-containing protein [Myxococcota bacterium]